MSADSVRRMPDPWFRAQSLATVIAEFTRPGNPYRDARDGERQLGPFVLPPFQRPAVWSEAQQVRLIESLWMNLPIGAYVYNLTFTESVTDGWLLDGQQRITAILRYVAGEFPVYGWRFTDLDAVEQRLFRQKPVAALQTSLSDVDGCRDVYERLAYGGTPHA